LEAKVQQMDVVLEQVKIVKRLSIGFYRSRFK